jgi:hypothetical protein
VVHFIDIPFSDEVRTSIKLVLPILIGTAIFKLRSVFSNTSLFSKLSTWTSLSLRLFQHVRSGSDSAHISERSPCDDVDQFLAPNSIMDASISTGTDPLAPSMFQNNMPRAAHLLNRLQFPGYEKVEGDVGEAS